MQGFLATRVRVRVRGEARRTHLGLFGGDVKMDVHWFEQRGLYALQGPKAAAVCCFSDPFTIAGTDRL